MGISDVIYTLLYACFKCIRSMSVYRNVKEYCKSTDMCYQSRVVFSTFLECLCNLMFLRADLLLYLVQATRHKRTGVLDTTVTYCTDVYR